MGLKELKKAIELAAAGRFESGANLSGVMTIVIDHGDVVDDALDVKAATQSGKFEEAFADQVRWNVQIQRDGRCHSCVAAIVHARRARQLEQTTTSTLVSHPQLPAP